MILSTNRPILERWLWAERYLSAGSKSYSPFANFSSVSDRYAPESQFENYVLKTIKVPYPQGEIIFHNADQSSLPIKNPFSSEDGFVIIPIHPDVRKITPDISTYIDANFEPGPDLTVVPTASTRTVCVLAVDGMQEPSPYFIKLHFPGRISRFTRPISEAHVRHQLTVSSLLNNSGAPLLQDIGGGFVNLGEQTSLGFLMRHCPLDSSCLGNRIIIPVFALGAMTNYGEASKLVVEKIAELFDEDIFTFLTCRLIAPVLAFWDEVVTKTAIIPEIHGQNLVVDFNLDKNSSQFFYRDSDLHYGPALRSKKDEAELDPSAYVRGEEMPAYLSLIFDSFFIENTIEPLLTSLENRHPVLRQRLKPWLRDHVSRMAFISVIAEDVYYYSNNLLCGEEFELVVQGAGSQWR